MKLIYTPDKMKFFNIKEYDILVYGNHCDLKG
jgi:hypothetical protein